MCTPWEQCFISFSQASLYLQVVIHLKLSSSIYLLLFHRLVSREVICQQIWIAFLIRPWLRTRRSATSKQVLWRMLTTRCWTLIIASGCRLFSSPHLPHRHSRPLFQKWHKQKRNSANPNEAAPGPFSIVIVAWSTGN